MAFHQAGLLLILLHPGRFDCQRIDCIDATLFLDSRTGPFQPMDEILTRCYEHNALLLRSPLERGQAL